MDHYWLCCWAWRHPEYSACGLRCAADICLCSGSNCVRFAQGRVSPVPNDRFLLVHALVEAGRLERYDIRSTEA